MLPFFFLSVTQAEQNSKERRAKEDLAHLIFNISGNKCAPFITELDPDSLARKSKPFTI